MNETEARQLLKNVAAAIEVGDVPDNLQGSRPGARRPNPVRSPQIFGAAACVAALSLGTYLLASTGDSGQTAAPPNPDPVRTAASPATVIETPKGLSCRGSRRTSAIIDYFSNGPSGSRSLQEAVEDLPPMKDGDQIIVAEATDVEATAYIVRPDGSAHTVAELERARMGGWRVLTYESCAGSSR